MIQLGSSTAIGDAITPAATALRTRTIIGSKQVIAVSPDGFSNVGKKPNTASANAITAGIEQPPPSAHLTNPPRNAESSPRPISRHLPAGPEIIGPCHPTKPLDPGSGGGTATGAGIAQTPGR